jgi:outer membrane protein assembly factor BamA
MSYQRTQVGVLLTACTLLIATRAIGQLSPDTIPKIESPSSCPGPHEGRSSGSDVRIDNVTFSGFLQMPVSDQQEIAASVRKETRGDSRNEVVEEALERVKAGWQDRGYFKVEVNGEAKEVASNASEGHIALFAHVDEHSRYTLKAISFEHGHLSPDFLRSRFLIKDGEFFSRAKIAEGLENLRKVYGEMGYINYTGVPKTEFDEKKRAISLIVDIDSGRQFFISGINLLGLSGSATEALLADFPLRTGDIYNSRLWELGLLRYSSMFPSCECRSNDAKTTDDQTGTVALTLDFRPCNN